MDSETAVVGFNLLVAIVCAVVASGRNRSTFWWFIFGGIFGLPALFILFFFFGDTK